MATYQEINAFVGEHYSGLYVSHLYKATGVLAEHEVWISHLYSPDGPKVFTLARPDGRLLDVSNSVHRLQGIDTLGRCEWFALCPNDAVKLIPHVGLGLVAACQSCADFVESC
jgi:hypothetical protein